MRLHEYPSMEEAVQALADHQLTWEDEKVVLSYMDTYPGLREQYEKIVEQNKLLRQWWHSLSTTTRN